MPPWALVYFCQAAMVLGTSWEASPVGPCDSSATTPTTIGALANAADDPAGAAVAGPPAAVAGELPAAWVVGLLDDDFELLLHPAAARASTAKPPTNIRLFRNRTYFPLSGPRPRAHRQ